MIYTVPPSLEDVEALARDALDTLPEELRQPTRDVILRIEEFPDAEIEHEMGLDSPFELMGLYHGVALTEKSVGDAGNTIDTILLYRRPLLDYWCETSEDLAHLIRHVLIHEIGHHFGWSDADMERIESEE